MSPKEHHEVVSGWMCCIPSRNNKRHLPQLHFGHQPWNPHCLLHALFTHCFPSCGQLVLARNMICAPRASRLRRATSRLALVG